MRRDEISAVTHGNLAFHNPLDPAQVDEVLDKLDLAPGDRVLDLGCGPGELLLRLHGRFGTGGLGIDSSPVQIEQARRRAAGTPLEFAEGDAGAHEGTGYALTACLGSMHAVGGLAGLSRLAAHTRPGGWVLIADGFWRRDPEPRLLESLGATRDELPDRSTLLMAGLRHGLRTTYVAETSEEAWDRYEWTLIHNGERDGRPDVLDWVARSRARYAGPGGRGTLGFALMLHKRPGPAR
jgi:SAM-dependent methyltransferase